MPSPGYLYVYILLCADNSFYVGVTNNPVRRLEQHNEGMKPKAYTYNRRPCQMVHQERYRDFLRAIAREKQIKRWSHAKKLALIAGDFEELHRLAQCRNETHYRSRLGFARRDDNDEPPEGDLFASPDANNT